MKSPFVDVSVLINGFSILPLYFLIKKTEGTNHWSLGLQTPPNFCQGRQLKYIHVAHLVPNQPPPVHFKSGYRVSYAF